MANITNRQWVTLFSLASMLFSSCAFAVCSVARQDNFSLPLPGITTAVGETSGLIYQAQFNKNSGADYRCTSDGININYVLHNANLQTMPVDSYSKNVPGVSVQFLRGAGHFFTR